MDEIPPMKIPPHPPSLKTYLNASKDGTHPTQFLEMAALLPSDIAKDRSGEYLHWEKLRHKPLPAGVSSHEVWWFLTKFRRTSAYRKLSLRAKSNENFVYWLTDPIQQRLHQIDQQASGRVEFPEDVTNEKTRNRYLATTLIEESITSSQLEGASTTYKVAKAMLRERRQPRDTSERMIYNNYQAMSFIREVMDQELSKDLLLEIHQKVTEATLEDPSSAGRFRLQNEEIGVYDNTNNVLLHKPPDAHELEERVEKICAFANSTETDSGFMHPVVRSILLHFMVAYDHPFVDGNGRTARALFYWSMAKQGYWLMEFISISSILKKAPAQYARAYLYTETDDNDTTYFLDYKLRVIIRALERLQEYLVRKANEIKQVELTLGNTLISRELNYRQLAVITHATRHPHQTYTIESHKNAHKVSYPTARADLLKLSELGLLAQRKVGKTFVFEAKDDIPDRIARLKARRD